MGRLVITNAKIILEDEILLGKNVFISCGKIDEITDSKPNNSDEIIDAKGRYLSAGFVDMHVHGGGGSDFMDGYDAYKVITDTHLAHGTTSIVPTTLASSYEETMRAVEAFTKVKNDKICVSNLLGLHLEGPYIAPSQAGAQPVKYLTDPIEIEYKKIIEVGGGNIIRWSSAPELKGSEKFSKYLIAHNIVCSIAHSNATYEEVLKAHDSGYDLITHLYSAMSSITREGGFRKAGVLESAFLIDDMNVEIIADGCHLPKSLLQYVVKFKNINSIALVTDAMRASGQNVVSSYLGSEQFGVPVIIEDGVAKLTDRTAFGGSVATSDRLVRTMVKLAGVRLVDAVKMMTINPIKMLKPHIKKGKIATTYDADLIVFDDDINIMKVIVNGKVIK